MVLLKLLILTLTFYKLIVHLDASCPKGQRVTRDNGCRDCSDGSFQPEVNHSQQCRACTKCDKESGSEYIENCTKERDAKCQCRRGFVPRDSDSSTCKCDIGFGLKHGGTEMDHTTLNGRMRECSKCEDGYFSASINSICQKWKECKSTGVLINGTRTSDAICNEESKSNTYVTTTSTSNKVMSLTTRLTTLRPREGAQTQKLHTTTTTFPPGHTDTTTNKVPPHYPSNAGNQIGMVLLIFGIVGLLVLTAVTCKLHLTPYMERGPAVQKNESLYRRPVEESGDGSLSSLKLNSGEP